MKSIKNMIGQLRDGNFAYVGKRIKNILFPVPNPIFYWDIFVMIKGTFESAKNVRTRVRKNCDGTCYKAGATMLHQLVEQFPHHPYNKQRIEEGEGICYVNVSNSDQTTILGYTWIKFRNGEPFITNAGMKVEYDEPIAGWGYGFYVIPECRLSNVFLQLTQAVRDACSEHNCTAIYSETDVQNVRSIKSFARMGKHVYEGVLVVSIFGMKFFFVKKAKGGYTVRLRYVPKTHEVLAIRDV